MILVVTGVHEHGFNRLVKAVDILARDGKIEDVFIQTGYSDYQPKYCKWAKSVEFNKFEKMMDDAEILVTHGGAGCIAGGLERNKPTIVVPRLKRFNEHNNDHQLELSSILAKAQRVLLVHEENELYDFIKKAKTFTPRSPKGKNMIVLESQHDDR